MKPDNNLEFYVTCPKGHKIYSVLSDDPNKVPPEFQHAKMDFVCASCHLEYTYKQVSFGNHPVLDRTEAKK